MEMPYPRIALVAPGSDMPGGQGVQAQALADALRGEGAEVRSIPIDPRFPGPLRWLRRVPYARTVLNEVLYLVALRRLRHVDVVHVFAASYWSFLLSPAPAMLAARALGKRTVLNYHSGEAEDHLARWGILVHPWLRLADEIVVPSEFLRRVFARHGYQARVIRNVVDTRRFRFRDRSPLRPRLVSTRNLEPHYRVEDTLAAFALVKARYPEATLTVAGYGTEEGRLRRLAARLGVGGIRFVGRVEPAVMPDVCDRADIFVNASVVDNQPLSVLEAFAAGLLVVSTGTGDIAAMVRHGETGLVVPPRDPAALARAVTAALDDPRRARLMARRAREEVRKYTWEEVRREWAAVHQIKSRSGRGEQASPLHAAAAGNETAVPGR
jgi:glycosyltransferase involved in cell wall biosynthesis